MKFSFLPTQFARERKTYTDVVGLELGAAQVEGVPAVRLRKREGRTELVAAGFLDLPGKLPVNPESVQGGAIFWTLPRAFQAPYAALVVSSEFAFLRHSTGPGEDTPENKQFAYREVSRVIAPDLPSVVVGLPKFQASWAAGLLPEGRRPTACSLQIAASAAISGFIATPAFAKAGGTAITLFVFPEYTALAAFQESRLVLYREHPVGSCHLRSAISSQMRIDIGLADAVLEDTLIDPVPMIEPVLRSLFRQVEISADYLLRRRNCPVANFFVCGLTAGSRYWSSIFAHKMNLPMTLCSPLSDIQTVSHPAALPKDLNAAAPLLMAAAGAARAVLEDV